MSNRDQPKKGGPGLQIIHASLFRMGTMSMATAYRTLGYSVHHGLLENMTDAPWALLERAAEATYPALLTSSSPSTTPPKHIRTDWDAIWGDRYDVATDLSCPFTHELAAAYPDAKIVIVQRGFDQWWPSFASQMRDTALPMPQAAVASHVLWYFLRCRAGFAVRKMLAGMFDLPAGVGGGAAQLDEACARRCYDEYFRRLRDEIAPERRLEFDPGRDGWGPLCGFLGVPVPKGEDGEEVEFPFVNTRASHKEETTRRRIAIFKPALKAALAFVVVGVAIGVWRAS
ncbi:Sulfotransferase domain-containing protein [Microdochium nivale]|nr:Sulfotransferase domain-containing protein [Microdochium nivale]